MAEHPAALSREERLYDAILDMLDFTVGWCRPSMTDAEKLDTICKIGEAAIKLDGDALPSGGVGADERAAEPERAPVNVGGELAKGTLPSDSIAASRDGVRDFYVVPYFEPDGSKTWAVREHVYRPDYYLRQLVSFHPTREDAEVGRVIAYRNAGIDVHFA